jgi:AraC-like DNA-binding protein
MEVRMIDPLAQVVALLQPTAEHSKIVSAAGFWEVRPVATDRAFYCAVLEGTLRLTVAGRTPIMLTAGDFVLVPSALDYVMGSAGPAGAGDHAGAYVVRADGEVRHGDPDAPAEVRLLGGFCTFRSQDAPLLASLLPDLVHIRGEDRLTMLVRLIVKESREQRAAREPILERLLEVMLIEALRSTTGPGASPGLLRGLMDERIAVAIRLMHANPERAWTVERLAREAALSRSTFFDRFRRAVGLAPMEYLLGWRMALAKALLRGKEHAVAEIAERVGYSSASTFTVAFARQTGAPPGRYARGAFSAETSSAPLRQGLRPRSR